MAAYIIMYEYKNMRALIRNIKFGDRSHKLDELDYIDRLLTYLLRPIARHGA